MHLRFLILVLYLLSSSQGIAGDSAPGKAAINKILLSSKTWTVYFDTVDATTPSNTATTWKWEFFEQDGTLKGRQLGLAFGSCELEITLRDDGFSFRWCPAFRHNNEPLLTYDPEDLQYPFKKVGNSPNKLWFHPDE
jgi:hypothetical protein